VFATTASCPSSFSWRDTHGECVLASRTTRHRGRPPKYLSIAPGVVATAAVFTILPPASISHTRLTLSPRSSPMVTLGKISSFDMVGPRLLGLRPFNGHSPGEQSIRYAATGRGSAFSYQLCVGQILYSSVPPSTHFAMVK